MPAASEGIDLKFVGRSPPVRLVTDPSEHENSTDVFNFFVGEESCHLLASVPTNRCGHPLAELHVHGRTQVRARTVEVTVLSLTALVPGREVVALR